MLKKIVLGIAVMSLVLAAPSLAHDPPDLIIPAAQFPAGLEPIIDGNPVEWGPISVETYGSVGELLFPVGAATKEGRVLENAGQGEINPADFQIRHKLGWSPNTNMMYWHTEVYDDLHVTSRLDPGRFWVDDSIEYGFNFKHQAIDDQVYNKGDVSTQFTYKWAVPPREGQYEFLNPRPERVWLLDGTKWLNFEYTFEGDEFGESTYFYEVSITPIEELPNTEDATEDQAVEGILQEGMVVHWGNMISDTDEDFIGTEDQIRETQWSTAPSGAAGRSSTDVLLAPIDPGITFVEQSGSTAVEAASWANIKAQYR